MRAVRTPLPAVALSADAAPSGRAPRLPALLARLRSPAPLLAVLAVLLPVAVAAGVTVARRPALVLGGDFAFVEQAVDAAEHGRQLLGSFDRFGFAHLGPAHYYLLAPVSWILGNRAYGLAVGSLVLAGASAAAVVAVAARRGGAGLALLSALLMIVDLHAIGDGRVWEPWGPWAILVPTVLFLVLAAAFATGSTPALLGALLVGTFIAQTHISTPPTLAAVLLAAALVRRLAPDREPSRPATGNRRRRLLLLGGLGILLLAAWTPTVVQQLTGHPGNLTLVYRFFRHPHGGFDGTGFPPTIHPAAQGLRTAVSGLGLELSVFPAGRPEALLREVGSPGVLPGAVRLGLVVGCGTLSALLAVLAWRRRDRFALTLGLATLTAMAAGVVSGTHVAGPFYDYLIAWMTALPVGLWLGWAALAAGWVRERRGRLAETARALLAGVLAMLVTAAAGAETVALAGQSSLVAAATPQGADPTLEPAVTLVRGDLARRPAGGALLRIVSPDTWPVAAAVANQLRRHHQPVAVAGAWVLMFGDLYRPTGAERVEYSFADASGPAGGPPGEERLGQVGRVSIGRRALAR